MSTRDGIPTAIDLPRESLCVHSSEQEQFFCGRSFSIPSMPNGSLSDELTFGDNVDLEAPRLPLDFLLASSRRSSTPIPQQWPNADITRTADTGVLSTGSEGTYSSQ